MYNVTLNRCKVGPKYHWNDSEEDEDVSNKCQSDENSIWPCSNNDVLVLPSDTVVLLYESLYVSLKEWECDVKARLICVCIQ